MPHELSNWTRSLTVPLHEVAAGGGNQTHLIALTPKSWLISSWGQPDGLFLGPELDLAPAVVRGGEDEVVYGVGSLK